jgi:hypothetical protein
MINYAYSIARLSRQIVTLGAFTTLSATFAAGGPPPVAIEGEVTVKGPVEIQGSVEVVNDALKTPFHVSRVIEFTQGLVITGANITLPAGKRLVIETISVRSFAQPGQFYLLSVNFSEGGVATDLAVALQLLGTTATNTYHAGTHAVSLRLKTATNLQVNATRVGGINGLGEVHISFHGYTEDI